mgnify:FL=1
MSIAKWEMFDHLPDGYKIDATAGSPTHGYVFATNGSTLKGGKRILVKAEPSPMPEAQPEVPLKKEVDKREPVVAATPLSVNDLARAKFKEKMLRDIMCDLMICEIEGWDKKEYINSLKELINSLAQAP